MKNINKLLLFTSLLISVPAFAAENTEEKTPASDTISDSSAPAPANTTPQIVESIPQEQGASLWGIAAGIRTTKNSSNNSSYNSNTPSPATNVTHNYSDNLAITIMRRSPLYAEKLSFQPSLTWTSYSMDETLGSGKLEFSASYLQLSPMIHLSNFLNIMNLPIFLSAGPCLGIKTNSSVEVKTVSGQNIDVSDNVPFNTVITSAQISTGLEFPIKKNQYLKRFILQTTYHLQISSLTKGESKTWEPKSLLFQIGTMGHF